MTDNEISKIAIDWCKAHGEAFTDEFTSRTDGRRLDQHARNETCQICVNVVPLIRSLVDSETDACAKLAQALGDAASLPGHPHADSREGMAREIEQAILARKST